MVCTSNRFQKLAPHCGEVQGKAPPALAAKFCSVSTLFLAQYGESCKCDVTWDLISAANASGVGHIPLLSLWLEHSPACRSAGAQNEHDNPAVTMIKPVRFV